jgi:hypothetical protein
MLFWMRRFARILGLSGFFLLFLAGIDYEDPFQVNVLLFALLKGILGGALFWFGGLIIADIFFKGIIEDITGNRLDYLEGGVVQRIQQAKDSTAVRPVSDTSEKSEDE